MRFGGARPFRLSVGINDTVEANEIDPKKWYPRGHRPDLVREWPLTEDVEIPNPDLGAGVPTGTFTVFSGLAGLLIGFADTLLDEGIPLRAPQSTHG